MTRNNLCIISISLMLRFESHFSLLKKESETYYGRKKQDPSKVPSFNDQENDGKKLPCEFSSLDIFGTL